MPIPPATPAKGTQLQIGDGNVDPGPESFLTIGRLTNIGGVEITRDVEDATAHDSPGGIEEVIATIRRTGEIPFEGQAKNADAGQLALVANLLDSDDPSNFRMIFPEPYSMQWNLEAYVVRIKVGDATVTGMVPFSGALKPTGLPALVAVV